MTLRRLRDWLLIWSLFGHTHEWCAVRPLWHCPCVFFSPSRGFLNPILLCCQRFCRQSVFTCTCPHLCIFVLLSTVLSFVQSDVISPCIFYTYDLIKSQRRRKVTTTVTLTTSWQLTVSLTIVTCHSASQSAKKSHLIHSEHFSLTLIHSMSSYLLLRANRIGLYSFSRHVCFVFSAELS